MIQGRGVLHFHTITPPLHTPHSVHPHNIHITHYHAQHTHHAAQQHASFTCLYVCPRRLPLLSLANTTLISSRRVASASTWQSSHACRQAGMEGVRVQSSTGSSGVGVS